MSIFSHFAGTQEHYLRAWLPADTLWSDLLQDGIEVRTGPFGSYPPDWYDVYIFHGIPPRIANWLFMAAKETNKRIVWNISEDYWSLPNWWPGDVDLTICDWLRDNADNIWVSTEHLKTVMGRGTVLPTLLHQKNWPEVDHDPNEPLRIVAAYSGRHQADVEYAMQVFERLIKKYGEKIICLFVGAFPESASELVHLPGRNTGQLVPAARYAGRLGYIKAVNPADYGTLLTHINGDIGVHALVDHPFNQAKSNLRLLDYSMAGMASVAEQDVDGVALTGDLYESCCRLIEDDPLRKRLASEARAKVVREWTWASPRRKLWLDAFREISR